MRIVFILLLDTFHAASPDPYACRAGETQATGDAHCDVHGCVMHCRPFALIDPFSGLYILAHRLPQPSLDQQLPPAPPPFDADCVIGRIVYNRY